MLHVVKRIHLTKSKSNWTPHEYVWVLILWLLKLFSLISLEFISKQSPNLWLQQCCPHDLLQEMQDKDSYQITPRRKHSFQNLDLVNKIHSWDSSQDHKTSHSCTSFVIISPHQQNLEHLGNIKNKGLRHINSSKILLSKLSTWEWILSHITSLLSHPLGASLC